MAINYKILSRGLLHNPWVPAISGRPSIVSVSNNQTMFGQLFGQICSGFQCPYRPKQFYFGQNKLFWPIYSLSADISVTGSPPLAVVASSPQAGPGRLMFQFKIVTKSFGQKWRISAKSRHFGQKSLYRSNNRFWPKLGFWNIKYLISVFRL